MGTSWRMPTEEDTSQPDCPWTQDAPGAHRFPGLSRGFPS